MKAAQHATVRQGDGVDTADRILDVAQRLAQTRGFNAFSYADIARELVITKAALHYHFATKADLGEALINRYTSRFSQALKRVETDGGDAVDCLDAYVDLFERVLADDRMCLCGVLAADFDTLPEAMQVAITNFFDLNERWLVTVLERGLASGDLRFSGSSAQRAQLILGTLEGSMLVARTYHDQRRFSTAAHRLLAELRAPTDGHPFT